MKRKVIIATKQIRIVSGVNSFIDDFINLFSSRLEIEKIESRKWFKVISKESLIYWHDFYSINLVLFLVFNWKYNRSIIIVSHGSFILTDWTKKYLLKKAYMCLVKILSTDKVRFQYLSSEEYNASFKFTNFFISAPCLESAERMIVKDRHKYKIENRRIEFLYISALSYERKGFDRLYKFIEDLTNTNIEFNFRIVGAELRDFQDYPEFLKLKNVEIFGRLSRSSIPALLETVDYVCLFSRSEGFPISLLEAVNHNKAIIVTKETNFFDFLDRYRLGYSLDELRDDITKLTSLPMSDFEGFRLEIFAQNRNLETLMLRA